MIDIEIKMPNKPGQLALMGRTLGKHKISLEGGGVFDNGEFSIAHFLIENAERAKEVLKEQGLEVKSVNKVIILKL